MHFYPKLFLLGMLVAGCTSPSVHDYPIKPVAFKNVKLRDHFWQKRIETTRKVTIPLVLDRLRDNGIIENFAIAGGRVQGKQNGNYPFDDSDLFKTMEGISNILAVQADSILESRLDSIIYLVGSAQEMDGYLYTARTNKALRFISRMGDSRWSNIGAGHELYNAGHLYEAAVAHYAATGKKDLLNIALKNAHLVLNTFGPNGLLYPPGHQEIEIGLIRLYRVTGNRHFLEQAKIFLDRRGYRHGSRKLWGEYAQDHKPVIEQQYAVGHAVRAAYMYAAMTDISALTGDSSYYNVSRRIWDHTINSKLYLIGGLGSVGFIEGFGAAYDLPNMSAYNETCASIANILWSHRLFRMSGDSKYIDVLEQTLYNALLAGISLQGDRFFYDNPLASRGQHERSPWLYCACCIGNLTRFLPTVPGYIYALADKTIYINLYIGSMTNLDLNGTAVRITQTTAYPLNGNVELRVEPQQPAEFSLKIRMPGWTANKPLPGALYRYLESKNTEIKIMVNGQLLSATSTSGYITIQRRWQKGDRIKIDFPMPVRRVLADKKLTENHDRVALQRGPIVYCAEAVDQPQGHVHNLVLSTKNGFKAEYEKNLLNGVIVIRGEAQVVSFGDEGLVRGRKQVFKAIPYHAWAHRGRGEMAVWMAAVPEAAKPLSAPALASYARVTSSGGTHINTVNDGNYPGGGSGDLFVWDHGDTVWIQYQFESQQEISETWVYWAGNDLDKTFRPPESWRMQALYQGEWRRIWNPSGEWTINKNGFSDVVFETVRTNAVRIEAIVTPGYTAGIHEWRIY